MRKPLDLARLRRLAEGTSSGPLASYIALIDKMQDDLKAAAAKARAEMQKAGMEYRAMESLDLDAREALVALRALSSRAENLSKKLK